jgi:hypothetical protein
MQVWFSAEPHSKPTSQHHDAQHIDFVERYGQQVYANTVPENVQREFI